MDTEYIYAAAMLHELNKEINEQNMKSVLDGAGANISESKIKALIAALEDVNIDRAIADASPELSSGQATGGASPAAAVPSGESGDSAEGSEQTLPDTADQQEVEDEDDDDGGALSDIF